jgi:hypothetical protein
MAIVFKRMVPSRYEHNQNGRQSAGPMGQEGCHIRPSRSRISLMDERPYLEWLTEPTQRGMWARARPPAHQVGE